MSQQAAIAMISVIGALILVGRALYVRRRADQPLGRYALIWAILFGMAFVFAAWRGSYS
ncbi:hypothetical protein [Sphingomonas sp.]|uniref:hypothetical protein n=1 Tax=Sphingomonas sp. TaxID=28214 RepID=UPI003B005329